ncbi:MAG: SPOR domain-containing protein [Cytophagaceae bacterium]|nr:SPOR domain-containing protein [Cytophagaceae bacterium]
MEKYIRDLLFDYECVIVPGFGGFLTHYVSADIHPITHKFLPPSRRIAFNENLKNNDGLLIEAVSSGENVSREEAISLIENFIRSLNESLSKKKFAELKDIGRFFYNTENHLEFEPDLGVNYLEDSFGLPELIFKPIERKSITMNKPIKAGQPTKKAVEDMDADGQPKKSKAALIIIPIILVLLGGATTFLYFNKDNATFASINPFVIFNKEDKAEVKPEPVKEQVTQVDSSQFVAEETSGSQIITSQTGRFFIVAGSFKNRENAMKLREKFENESVNASLIEPYGKKKFYRVAIADFDSKESAKQKLTELEAQYGKSLWILTY